MKRYIMLTGSLILILIVGLALYAGQIGPVDLATAQVAVEIPFLDQWTPSGHADAAAEAFVHWDEDDPAEIPVECAKCHSTPGHQDFLGADGTAAGVVNAAAPIGTVIECTACHNEASLTKDSVVMPSGVEIADLGREARCMECHQGRESGVSVDEAITEAAVADEDTISEDLGFLNIHYYAAAATKYGTVANGGYQYEGQTYDANFAHVDEYDTCIECHNSHTLEVRVEECAACHAGVATVDDLKDVRMAGSLVDYDGDGDVEEGIYFELEGLRELLYQAIQAYGEEVTETPILYDSASYPYFFADADGDGEVGEDDERYAAWTPRLLKAGYNYQVSTKDPGAFAHGGKYIIQLLHDSIMDLNTTLSSPVDVADAVRVDAGHFAGSEEPFRHWDEDGETPGSCSKCHSAGGLPTFLKDGAVVSEPLANGFQCTTCHESLSLEVGELAAPRHVVDEVTFPSGAVLSFGEGEDANLCLQCHQGRESKYSVDALLTGLDAATVADLSASELLDTVSEATETLDDDTVADNLRFLNIHYFAAGATRFGAEAQGAYEYDGKEYVGFYDHFDDYQTCTDCHGAHALQVDATACAECHDGVESHEDLLTIRESDVDYDGDGDATEGLAEEVDTMREALYAALQDYAASTTGADDIIYDSHSYPYFFIDTNGNGEVDEAEADRYASWTPRLLKAAYNYQYAAKDPGAYTHNGPYILQILYDSLEDMDADVDDMTRPEPE